MIFKQVWMILDPENSNIYLKTWSLPRVGDKFSIQEPIGALWIEIILI